MADDIETQPGPPCPHCRRPSVQRFRPFCCKRCADIDLNRWLSGVYAVPAVESDDDSEKPEPGAEDRSPP